MSRSLRWEHAVLALGLGLLTFGHYQGLFVAPPEAMMGEVGRILYVHVPTAWVGLLTFSWVFVAAIGALWTGSMKWDAAVEATAEVGVVLCGLLLVQGSIWARPTWNVWWTWDPRLTTTAVMAISFVVVLILRRVIDAPGRRLTVSAVASIVAFVNVPIVYMSVKWWRTLHQPFSSPETVDSPMVTPLRIAAFGMLFLSIALCTLRWRIAHKRLAAEAEAPELPPEQPQLTLPSEVS